MVGYHLGPADGSLHSTTTESNPGQKAPCQDSGSESYAHCLEWPLLDRMLCFLDYVFGGMATMLDGLACRAHSIFHHIRDDRPNLGNLASNILNRCRFFQYVGWPEPYLLN